MRRPVWLPNVSSKHAAGGLSSVSRWRWLKEGIRVNTICPGAVDTPMMCRIEAQWLGEGYTREQALATFAAQYPDGKYADPARTAAYGFDAFVRPKNPRRKRLSSFRGVSFALYDRVLPVERFPVFFVARHARKLIGRSERSQA